MTVNVPEWICGGKSSREFMENIRIPDPNIINSEVWIIASEPAFSGTIEEGKMAIVMFDIEHTYCLAEKEAGDGTVE